MRRRRPEKRKIVPDPVYNDLVVAKFVNNLMKNGKKSVAEKIFYKSLSLIEKKEKSEDSLIAFPSITVTVLPTVLKDCGVFPGEMTIIGTSAANILFTGNISIIVNLIIFFSISIYFMPLLTLHCRTRLFLVIIQQRAISGGARTLNSHLHRCRNSQ